MREMDASTTRCYLRRDFMHYPIYFSQNNSEIGVIFILEMKKTEAHLPKVSQQVNGTKLGLKPAWLQNPHFFYWTTLFLLS